MAKTVKSLPIKNITSFEELNTFLKELDRQYRIERNSSGITILEEDGTPKATNINTIKVSNNKMAVNTDGSVSLDLQGGASGSDMRLAVDAAASPDYLGIDASTGVLRTSGLLTKTDGGDYVTLGLNIDLSLYSNATSQFITAADVHSHTNKTVLDGITATQISNWDTSYLASHSHTNISALDNLTQTVIDNSHTHTNKTDLDSITATKISNWDTVYSWYNGSPLTGYATETWVTNKNYLTAETDPIFTASAAYGITSTQISNWETAYTNNHTHSNKAYLDVINQNLATTNSPTFAGLTLNGTTSVISDTLDFTVGTTSRTWFTADNSQQRLNIDTNISSGGVFVKGDGYGVAVINAAGSKAAYLKPTYLQIGANGFYYSNQWRIGDSSNTATLSIDASTHEAQFTTGSSYGFKVLSQFKVGSSIGTPLFFADLTNQKVGIKKTPTTELDILGTITVDDSSTTNTITTTKIGNWDTAYSWGNHASVGYLTSYTETDPIFVASPSYGITSTQITNWGTAYTNNHTHSNKTILDTITSANQIIDWREATVSFWTTDTVSVGSLNEIAGLSSNAFNLYSSTYGSTSVSLVELGKLTLTADNGIKIIDTAGNTTITSTVMSSLTSQAHSHSNKSLLDTITSANQIIDWTNSTSAFYSNVNSTTAFKVEQAGVKTNTLVVDTTNGRVGICKTPYNVALDVTGSSLISGYLRAGSLIASTSSVTCPSGTSLYVYISTMTSTNITPFKVASTVMGSVDNVAIHSTPTSSGTYSFGNTIGIKCEPKLNGTCTATNFVGGQFGLIYTSYSGTQTTTNSYGIYVPSPASTNANGAIALTTLAGLNIENQATKSGVGSQYTFDNSYGIKIDAQTGTGNVWGIWSGGGQNAFGGYTSFGKTTAPSEAVDVEGNVKATGFKTGTETGVSGSFTTTDGKTVTVTNGLITSIV